MVKVPSKNTLLFLQPLPPASLMLRQGPPPPRSTAPRRQPAIPLTSALRRSTTGNGNGRDRSSSHAATVLPQWAQKSTGGVEYLGQATYPTSDPHSEGDTPLAESDFACTELGRAVTPSFGPVISTVEINRTDLTKYCNDCIIADLPILSSSTRNGSWRYGSCGTGHLLVKRSGKQLLSTNLRRPIGSPTATSVQNRDPSFS